MDKIYECASGFRKLMKVKYRMVVSRDRKSRELILDFAETDFRHASGLHYIDDIEIESTLKERGTTAYIFLRKRQESDNYVIVSFFQNIRCIRGLIYIGC